MKNILLVALSLLLVSCAGSSDVEEETTPTIGAEACLENPKLAKAWGECNIKKTIYDRAMQIGQCTKNSKNKKTSILKIKVLENGKVKDVEFDDLVKNNKAVPCLRREFTKLKFAPPPKGANPEIMLPVEI